MAYVTQEEKKVINSGGQEDSGKVWSEGYFKH